MLVTLTEVQTRMRCAHSTASLISSKGQASTTPAMRSLNALDDCSMVLRATAPPMDTPRKNTERSATTRGFIHGWKELSVSAAERSAGEGEARRAEEATPATGTGTGVEGEEGGLGPEGSPRKAETRLTRSEEVLSKGGEL